MNEQDRTALDAIARIFQAPPARIGAGRFVRHDPLTGRAYVHLDPILAAGMEHQGYDPETYRQNYEANLRRQGLWPADLPPVVGQRARVRRWSRRGWRVVVGGRRKGMR